MTNLAETSQPARATTSPPHPALQVSIVVPALREAANIPTLTRRLAAAMAPTGLSWELLIVDDDSRDGTEHVCADLSSEFPIRLLVRRPPKDGLGGAVLDGFRQTHADILVVMDADLQHPPEKVPDLIAALANADFALGSRYTAGGGFEGHWSAFRAFNSRFATWLARPFAPGITDPMSGFFALRRTTYQRAERLTPLGYKIALELICKCRVAKPAGGQGVVEVPITFAQRSAGTSKLSAREQFRYLEHLSRLYDYTFPRASPVAKFIISVLLALIPTAALWYALPASPLTRIAIAYPVAMAVTALLHLRYVSAQREFIISPRPWRDFIIISAGEYLAALLATWYLTLRMPSIPRYELLLIPLCLATLTRYILRKEMLHDIRGLRREPRQFH